MIHSETIAYIRPYFKQKNNPKGISITNWDREMIKKEFLLTKGIDITIFFSFAFSYASAVEKYNIENNETKVWTDALKAATIKVKACHKHNTKSIWTKKKRVADKFRKDMFDYLYYYLLSCEKDPYEDYSEAFRVAILPFKFHGGKDILRKGQGKRSNKLTALLRDLKEEKFWKAICKMKAKKHYEALLDAQEKFIEVEKDSNNYSRKMPFNPKEVQKEWRAAYKDLQTYSYLKEQSNPEDKTYKELNDFVRKITSKHNTLIRANLSYQKNRREKREMEE